MSRTLASVAMTAALTLAVLAGCSSDGDEPVADGATVPAEAPRSGADGADGDEPDDDQPDGDQPDGDEGGSTHRDDDAYVRGIAMNLDTSPWYPEGPSRADYTCVATEMVGIIGADRFAEAGLQPGDIANSPDGLDFSSLDLDEEEGLALYETYASCDIDHHDLLLSLLRADDASGAAAVACMEGVLTEDAARTFTVAAMTMSQTRMENDPEAGPVAMELLACGTSDG